EIEGLRNHRSQRSALDELHDDEPMSIRFANLVNRHDVRMVERGRGARFALESRASIGIGGERLRQNLDRDVASELPVSRAIPVAHSTGADERSDLVGSKTLAGERRRVRLK